MGGDDDGGGEQPIDDYAGDTSTTGILEVGSYIYGELETYGDHDWFAITLEANTTYNFSGIGDGDGEGAEISIRNSAGNIIETYGPFLAEGDLISIDYTNLFAGNYFLDVGAANDAGIGWYEINLSIAGGDDDGGGDQPNPNDDYSSDTNTTGSLTVGGSVTGVLEEYGDSDWFAITLEAGNTYQFDQVGPIDAYLYLRDSSGNQVAHDDQSGGNNNAQIIYTATESGTYYLDAQS